MPTERYNDNRLAPAWLLLIVALGLLLSAPFPLHALVQVGGVAPDFSVADLNGKRFTLSTSLKSLKDQQLLVLYFFDADSLSNREGLISFLRIAETHTPPHIVIGISTSPREKLAQFAREDKRMFRLFVDDGTVGGLYNARVILPVTCVVDRGQRVVEHHMGGGKGALALFESVTYDKKRKSTKTAPRKPVVTSKKGQGEQAPVISLTTSKDRYRNGEYISMELAATEDVYLHLYHVASNGAVTLVIPNQLQPYVLLSSGENMRFPVEDIELQANSTPGSSVEREQFVVIATKEMQELEKHMSRKGITDRAALYRLIATIPERERAIKTYSVINE